MHVDFEKKFQLNENLHREEPNSLKQWNSRETKKLKNNYSQELINLHTKCVEARNFIEQLEHKLQGLEQDKETLVARWVVNQVHCKKRTNREFRLDAQIGDYDMDNIILDMGYDVNVIMTLTWETIEKPSWSGHLFS